MSVEDPWGDGNRHTPIASSGKAEGPDHFGALNQDSQTRRRRQRARNLILWIGIPLLSLILLSEVMNVVLRSRNDREMSSLKVVEAIVRNAPRLIPEQESARSTPPPSNDPLMTNNSSANSAPEPVTGVDATIVGPTEVRISWDESDVDGSGATTIDVSGPGTITILSGYAIITDLQPETSYEYELVRRGPAGDSPPSTVVFSTPPAPPG